MFRRLLLWGFLCGVISGAAIAQDLVKVLDWSFSYDNPVLLNPSQAELVDGALRLKFLDQEDSTSADFSGAVLTNTSWDPQNEWVGVTGVLTLPDNGVPKSDAAWTDMTNNLVLLHGDASISSQGNAQNFSNSSGQTITAACTRPACPQVDADGRLGSAIWFDGKDDELILSGTYGGSDWTEATFETWVRFDGVSTSQQALIESDGISFIHFQAMQNNTVETLGCPDKLPNGAGVSAVFISNEGAESYVAFPVLGFGKFGQWRHVAVTAKAGKPGTVVMYINGKSVCTKSAAFDNLMSTAKLYLGRGWSGDPNRRLRGALDEVALYKRALSEDEIKAHYDRQSTLFAGSLDSRVINVGGSVDWTKLTWLPAAPNGVQLPDNATGEKGYVAGNVNMGGNVLLAHLNEQSGTEFSDASGQNNKGTCSGTGCPAPGMDGRFATAASFDGVDDQISIPSSPSLSVSSAVTVEAWIYPATLPSQSDGAAIVSKGNAGNDARYELLLINAQTTPGVFLMSNSAFFRLAGHKITIPDPTYNYASFVHGGNIPLSAWSHVAGTYDGSVISLYINGVLIASQPMTGGPITTDSDPLMIGVRQMQSSSTGKSHFKGMIDEVAVYNRALGATEILSRYLRGALQPKFQVRSCAKPDCADTSFVGPGNSDKTFFVSSALATAPMQTVTLSGIANNPYFQYRVFFESGNASVFPAIKSVAVGPGHYPATSPSVVIPTGQTFAQLNSFADVMGEGNAGEVRYQLSPNGNDWYFCYGIQWQKTTEPLALEIPELGELQKTNSAAKVNACATGFATDAGTGKIFLKAFLHSPTGVEPVILKYLKVGYELAPPPVPSPPAPATIALADMPMLTVTEGGKFSLTLDVSKAGMTAPYQFMCKANCPEGMSINAGSGEISWTPTYKQAGKYTDISFKATDATGKEATQSLSVVVQEGVAVPKISTPGDKVVNPGEVVSFTVSAISPDGSAPAYTLAFGKLEGMELDGSTGKFSWIPTSEQVGSHVVTLRATDPADSKVYSDQAIVIMVNKSTSAAITEAGTPQPPVVATPAGTTTDGTQATTVQPASPAAQPAAVTVQSGCSLIR